MDTLASDETIAAYVVAKDAPPRRGSGERRTPQATRDEVVPAVALSNKSHFEQHDEEILMNFFRY